MALQVRRLTADDDRRGFRSGNVDIDRFFSRVAGQNQFRHHIGTTYVAIDDAGVIAGFATVSPSELAPEAMSASKRRGLPKYSVPVLRLARLGVDERMQRAGIGALLVRSVLVLAKRMADDFGCVSLIVDAKPESVAYYEKLGFFPLEVVAGESGDRPPPVAMFIELVASARTERRAAGRRGRAPPSPALLPQDPDDQRALEQFQDTVIDRLFVLNAERAEEEKRLGAGKPAKGKAGKKRALKQKGQPRESEDQGRLFGEDES